MIKRICFLISSIDNSGGTERVTCLLANKLIGLNYNVDIISLSGKGQSAFVFDHRIRIHYLYEKKPSFKKNYFECIYKIRKILKYSNVEILIDVDSILTVFSRFSVIGLNLKHICWEHFNFEEDLGVKFRKWGRRLAASHCDYIVTLTEKDKELWTKGLKKIRANIIAISNPSPYENIQSFPKLENKTAIALGRLTYQKSFNFLLEAWAKVYRVYPDWRLLIIGSGEDENNLKLQAKELGLDQVVQFVAVTQNVIQYYENASLYCMSSRFEGLPMVLLEAQAFGLPIVSFDCNTGPSDLIDHDKNGYLVECFDTKIFADSIVKVIELNDSEYKFMCLQAKEKNKEYYCDNIVNQWVKVLEN